MKERDMSIEVLRILAAAMVVLLHVSAGFWASVDVRSAEWQVFNFYDSLARSCVPVFVMISGMFLLSPKRNVTIRSLLTKNVFRLFTAYVVWSFVYMVYMYIRTDKVWNAETMNWVITRWIEGHYHLWYLPVLAGLYVLTPALRVLTEKGDKRLLEYLIGLFFVFGIVKKTILLFEVPTYFSMVISNFGLEAFTGFIGYYLLGYYLYTYGLPLKGRVVLYVLGVISVVVTTLVSVHFAFETNKPSAMLYGNFSITTFFEAVALVVFFKTWGGKWKPSVKVAKVIQRLSSLTFGVYLVHAMIIRELAYMGITTLSFHTIISVPVIALLALVVSFVISFLLSKIKYINRFIV